MRNFSRKQDTRRIKDTAIVKLVSVLSFSILIMLGIWLIQMMDSKTQTFVYDPISGPISNPLMGLAPWARDITINQLHTLVYADLSWRDFEPQPGVYNFEQFENRNNFERWRAEGKRVVFRFYCDYPKAVAHLDIPDWLYTAINGDGEHYSSDQRKGFSPNYSNPIFIEYHQKVIRALGERYGEDAFFAYVELGSLGHWGEWHTDEDTGARQMPLTDIRDLYIMHYYEAFPNTHLLMRRPFATAQHLNLGLFNDMTGDLESTQEWLGWINYGGEFNETGEPHALRAMPDAWMLAPIGGEQTGSITDEDLYVTKLDQTIQLLRESHTTFIGPGGPYKSEYKGPYQTGIDQVLANVGYRLYIKELIIPRKLIIKEVLEIEVLFSNDGVAPIYYNWPTVFYFFDQNNNLRASYPTDLDIRNILPGEFYTRRFSLPLNQLENGLYHVGIAILDPLTNKPAVRFAMQNNRQDLIQQLGSFEIFHLNFWQKNPSSN